MPLIAGFDGARLEILDADGECRFAFEPPVERGGYPQEDLPEAAEQVSDEAAGDVAMASADPVDQAAATLAGAAVEAPMRAVLLPVEWLLQRPFSLPFEHPRFVDAATLAQELADQAGAREQAWWLAWQAQRASQGVRGLVFAMPQAMKQALELSPIGRACPCVVPDVVARLAARLPSDVGRAGVLDADAGGLMLGMCIDGTWCGMRRLNLTPGKDIGMLAGEAVASMRAMGLDASGMPLFGRLDATWKQAIDAVDGTMSFDWQVEMIEADEALPGRSAANAMAMAGMDAGLPFNFRHATWAVQTDWGKRMAPWRRSAVLFTLLAMLGLGHDVWQLHDLKTQQEASRKAIEQAFQQALSGVPMIDPMMQLRQAAGGGASANAWQFVRQVDAVAKLGKQERGFTLQTMSFADGEVMLGGTVVDFAAANRVRDALSGILGREVDLLDTDLSDKQVRIRLRWGS